MSDGCWRVLGGQTEKIFFFVVLTAKVYSLSASVTLKRSCLTCFILHNPHSTCPLQLSWHCFVEHASNVSLKEVYPEKTSADSI